MIQALDEIGPEADADELLEQVEGPLSTDDDLTVLTLRPDTATGSSRVTEDIELDSHVAGLGELRYFLTAAGLDARQAQRTQTEAMHRAHGRIARLRIHHGGDGETNWEFLGEPRRPDVAKGGVPHLELVIPEPQVKVSAPRA